MKKIAAGKAFFMQSKHVKVNYLLLTRIQSSPGAFADLPRSMSDAAAFYRAEEGTSKGPRKSSALPKSSSRTGKVSNTLWKYIKDVVAKNDRINVLL